MVYIIIGIGICLIINAIVASLMKKASILKGYGEDAHVWAICFWFGILGDLYVISLPDKITQEQNQQIISLLEQKDVR